MYVDILRQTDDEHRSVVLFGMFNSYINKDETWTQVLGSLRPAGGHRLRSVDGNEHDPN